MNTTDWVVIGTALFLGACALFVPYLSELIKRKAFKPDIKIFFDLAPPYCHLTFWRTPPQAIEQINEPVYYFRFQVSNENGKSTANNCEVYLEKLWIYDSSNRPKQYPNFSPVNMIWVGPKNIVVNLNPGRKIFCDIGHISSRNYQEQKEKINFIDVHGYKSNDLRFMLDSKQNYNSQPNCLGPGKYIIQVSFYCENAPTQKLFYEISWSGKWNEIEDHMFREIVIEPVNEPKTKNN